jgi:hypothetical protein
MSTTSLKLPDDVKLLAQVETLESGQAYAANAVHTYARDRARGELVTRPEAGSWRK